MPTTMARPATSAPSTSSRIRLERRIIAWRRPHPPLTCQQMPVDAPSLIPDSAQGPAPAPAERWPQLDPAKLPRAADPQAAVRGLERWRERQTALPGVAATLAEDPGGRALLAAVFGNSPFLSHCLLEEFAIL